MHVFHSQGVREASGELERREAVERGHDLEEREAVGGIGNIGGSIGGIGGIGIRDMDGVSAG